MGVVGPWLFRYQVAKRIDEENSGGGIPVFVTVEPIFIKVFARRYRPYMLDGQRFDFIVEVQIAARLCMRTPVLNKILLRDEVVSTYLQDETPAVFAPSRRLL